jgi:DNA-binding transcriptional LysR family regulator
MLNKLDFNKLKVFYCIHQNQSVIEAAKTLNVTPSAISQHLKKLEADLGVHLFTRMHKKLVPTVEAETLFRIIDPFVHELEAGIRFLKNGQQRPAGMLRMGAPVEFGKENFPRIIGAFRQSYPEVTFSLTLGNTEKLLGMVKNGKLEFAVVDLFLNQRKYVSELGTFHVEPISDEAVVLACSETYFEERLKGDLSLSNILSRDFISYDQNVLALSGWFRHHFEKQSVKINTVLTVDSFQAVLSAIKNDIGLGIITDRAIQKQNQKEKKIVAVKTGKKEIVNKISLVQLQDKVPNFTEKTFLSHLKKHLKKVGKAVPEIL